MSFTDYNLLKRNSVRFVGLQNFITILTDDPVFFEVLGFSFIYTFSLVFFSYVVGMGIALILNKPLKARGIYRTVILLPWVIAPMVMATNWMWLLNDKFGLINRLLLATHIIEEPILFFVSKNMTRFTVILVGVWKNLPFMTITLLAGMQGIPHELYEAAIIDGCNGVKAFFKITLPLIKSVTFVSTTLLFIWAFNGFENIYLLTEGGPSGSTMVLPIYSYNTAFFRSQMGYASAISVTMMFFMIILTLFYQKQSRINQE